MHIIRETVQFIFSIALFINAFLFLPQSLHIIKKKTAQGVSLLTFLGFLLINIAVVLHGLIIHDYLLVIGYLLSVITCGSVVILVLIYGKNNNS